MANKVHPCRKGILGTRYYEQKTVETIKAEFAEYGFEAHQTFIDFEREYGGYLVSGKKYGTNWYLSLEPFDGSIEDGILFVPFAEPCVAQPYYYLLAQD